MSLLLSFLYFLLLLFIFSLTLILYLPILFVTRFLHFLLDFSSMYLRISVSGFFLRSTYLVIIFSSPPSLISYSAFIPFQKHRKCFIFSNEDFWTLSLYFFGLLPFLSFPRSFPLCLCLLRRHSDYWMLEQQGIYILPLSFSSLFTPSFLDYFVSDDFLLYHPLVSILLKFIFILSSFYIFP
jgi:hypothetical protein